jgi:hypothetical protein
MHQYTQYEHYCTKLVIAVSMLKHIKMSANRFLKTIGCTGLNKLLTSGKASHDHFQLS